MGLNYRVLVGPQIANTVFREIIIIKKKDNIRLRDGRRIPTEYSVFLHIIRDVYDTRSSRKLSSRRTNICTILFGLHTASENYPRVILINYHVLFVRFSRLIDNRIPETNNIIKYNILYKI